MQSHPFMDFSSGLYSKPGVADACLFVQERYGLNVDLILFCLWVADIGGGNLTVGQISHAMRRIADWERQVIKPLREIRRACRQDKLGVPEFLLQEFIPQLETIELEAGRVEQLVLSQVTVDMKLAEDGFSDFPEQDAVHSLKVYLDLLDVAQDEQLTECLSGILGAAFTGAGFPAAESPGC